MIVEKTVTIKIDTDELERQFSLCEIPEDATEQERQEILEALVEDANRYITEVSEDPYSIMENLDYFNY